MHCPRCAVASATGKIAASPPLATIKQASVVAWGRAPINAAVTAHSRHNGRLRPLPSRRWWLIFCGSSSQDCEGGVVVVGYGKYFFIGISKFKTIAKINKNKISKISSHVSWAYDTPPSRDSYTTKSKMLSNVTLFLRI